MELLLNKCRKAYNQSHAIKSEFYRLIYQSSGLLPKAFEQGILADFITSHHWKD